MTNESYSPFASLMQCGIQTEAVQFYVRCSAPRRFWCREKQSARISVIWKLLLNHNELERVFYMKKLRLVNIFPTAYHLHHSDERFEKSSRKTTAATCCPPHRFQN